MKTFLLACCISIIAAIPAKAQVAKADFDKQVKFFKAELDQHSTNLSPATSTRAKLVDMMLQQINYMKKKHEDKDLNSKCALEKRTNVQDKTACQQLDAIASTLNTEKNCLNAVNAVADKDLYSNESQLMQQVNTFSGTLQ
jgi:hypothetical protein